MNKIITLKGEYLANSFTGSNGTWNLVGTESDPVSNKPLDALDTFKNRKGELNTVKRSIVLKLAEEGKIS